MDDVNVIAGEIGEEKSSSDSTPTASGADVLSNLETLIKSHNANIDKLKTELKQHREMFEDICNNDATYKEHNEKVKQANKIKLATRKQLLSTPSAAALGEKVKELRTQLKETEGALSEYLQEYARMTGNNVFEGEDGVLMEIVYIAKLVKKSRQTTR